MIVAPTPYRSSKTSAVPGDLEALLRELPTLGPAAFRCVRMAYGQLRHINYLTTEFPEWDARRERPEGRERRHQIADAYRAACKQGATRIAEALAALRRNAPRESYTEALPPLAGLTDKEEFLRGR
jgi:hypothetical protein